MNYGAGVPPWGPEILRGGGRGKAGTGKYTRERVCKTWTVQRQASPPTADGVRRSNHTLRVRGLARGVHSGAGGAPEPSLKPPARPCTAGTQTGGPAALRLSPGAGRSFHRLRGRPTLGRKEQKDVPVIHPSFTWAGRLTRWLKR